MSKFAVVKHFDLGFVNAEWKEKGAYLEFEAFSVSDIKNKLTKLAQLDNENQDEIADGLDQMVKLLEDKFISGKAVDTTKKLVDVTKDDLVDFPIEVVSKAVSFLSQGLNKPS